MKPVKAENQASLGTLLERARRRLFDEVEVAVRSAGFEDLRVGHLAVFGFLPDAGARLTVLARRARVTKQSMGEMVRELERLGYVVRGPDPADGRARIVAFTERGRRARDIGVGAIDAIEARWAVAAPSAPSRGLRT